MLSPGVAVRVGVWLGSTWQNCGREPTVVVARTMTTWLVDTPSVRALACCRTVPCGLVVAEKPDAVNPKAKTSIPVQSRVTDVPSGEMDAGSWRPERNCSPREAALHQ